MNIIDDMKDNKDKLSTSESDVSELVELINDLRVAKRESFELSEHIAAKEKEEKESLNKIKTISNKIESKISWMTTTYEDTDKGPLK